MASVLTSTTNAPQRSIRRYAGAFFSLILIASTLCVLHNSEKKTEHSSLRTRRLQGWGAQPPPQQHGGFVDPRTVQLKPAVYAGPHSPTQNQGWEQPPPQNQRGSPPQGGGWSQAAYSPQEQGAGGWGGPLPNQQQSGGFPPQQHFGVPPPGQQGFVGTPPGQLQLGGPPPNQQGFGGPLPGQQQFGGPLPNQQGFGGPPPNQQGFGAPPLGQQQFGGPPPNQQGFGAPPPGQQQFGDSPPNQQGFGAPPPGQQQFGGPQHNQQGEGGPLPGQQQFGDSPPNQQGFGGPPPGQQQFGGLPPKDLGFGDAPPGQQLVGVPPQNQQGFGGPPPGDQQQFGGPPLNQQGGLSSTPQGGFIDPDSAVGEFAQQVNVAHDQQAPPPPPQSRPVDPKLPTYVQLCTEFINRREYNNGYQPSELFIVRESQKVCESPDTFLSIMTMLVSSMVAQAGSMWRLSYQHGCETTTDLTTATIQQMMPNDLTIAMGAGIEAVTNLCKKALEDPEMLRKEGHYALGFPKEGLYNVDPTLNSNRATAFRHNMYTAVNKVNRLEKVLHLPPVNQGAVIYMDLRSQVENKYVELPPKYYFSKIPPDVPAISVVVSPACQQVQDCVISANNLLGMIQNSQEFSRIPVTMEQVPSTSIAMARIMDAPVLICPPTMMCLLPALWKPVGHMSSLGHAPELYPWFQYMVREAKKSFHLNIEYDMGVTKK